jgi:hypothetical protein
MKKNISVFVFIILMRTGVSQLLPSLGLNTLPANSATICQAPWYLGSFYASGIQAGNSVPDFKLYDLNGDSLVLSNELAANKPVALIAGSLTCPVFRSKVNTINQVMATYGSAIRLFVIYTLEAHPTDTSVYFGYVNVTNQNTNANILFSQPTTYGQRKQMADTMSSFVSLNAPVFIDGPCNEWWSTFGPAPNNAYIISPQGKVIKKHGWFDKTPDRIFCDLDSILAVTSGSCVNTTAPGTFSISVVNSTVNGSPGDLLYDFVKVINTESVNVTIATKKIQKNHPAGWQTAFCADVCYSTSEDSIGFTIAPFDTLLFSLDFYTDANPDSGSVKVGFKNINKSNNAFSIRLRASTLPSQVGVQEYNSYSSAFQMWPNPADNTININASPETLSITIYDVTGILVYAAPNKTWHDISSLPPGVYYIKAGVFTRKLLKR